MYCLQSGLKTHQSTIKRGKRLFLIFSCLSLVALSIIHKQLESFVESGGLSCVCALCSTVENKWVLFSFGKSAELILSRCSLGPIFFTPQETKFLYCLATHICFHPRRASMIGNPETTDVTLIVETPNCPMKEAQSFGT